MMGLGGTWFVLVLVLVGVAVALAIGSGSRSEYSARGHDILRRRLAAGEIDQDEYRERAEVLGSGRDSGSSAGRWLSAMLVALAVLLLGGLLAAGSGRSGDGWWGPMGGNMDGMWGQSTSQDAAPAAVPGADEITVAMTEMEFDPGGIEMTAGEPANLTVTNRGEAFHDLTIDGLDLQIGVDSGQAGTAGLDVDQPGEYGYYCSVPGHASAGMRGTLTVTQP